MWNIVLTVNSVLCAAAVFFTVYARRSVDLLF